MHQHHTVSAESTDELKALLEYTVNHNTSHTDELLQIAKKLGECGKAPAGEKVIAALEEYKKGNALLAEALENLKQGDEK